MASVKTSLSAFLCALPSALAANLLVSHFSGNLYSLSLTDGGNGTSRLSVEQSLRAGGTWPSWLTLDVEARVLYVTDESTWGQPIISQLSVSCNGTLEPVVTAKTDGGSLHSCLFGGEDGKGFLAGARYEPSSIDTWKLPLSSDSQPAQTLNFTMDEPGPVPDRQNKPHPHSAFTDPTGEYFLTADLGADLIRIFSINATSGELTSCANVETGPGEGPRHGAWWVPEDGSTDGTMLYIINELANSITVWEVGYSDDCLSLENTQSVSTYPPDTPAPDDTKAAEVQVKGNMLYATNRNDESFGPEEDSVITYSIDPSSGALEFVESTSAYSFFPRTFEINKAGDMVAFGGQTSSTVAIVARNTTTGRLGDLIASVEVGSPGTVNDEDGLSDVIWLE